MTKTLALTLILAAVLSTAAVARDGHFGLGVIVGEPTGLSAKVWLSPKSALDFAAAWSFEKHTKFHLHADYLLHSFHLIKVEKGELPLYFGVGGRLILREHEHDDLVGIRIPVGLEYLMDELPLDIFVEVVPVVNLAPDTDADMDGGIGIRYMF